MTTKPNDEDLELEESEKEEDVYTEEGREELVEEDQLSDAEEGFAEGFEEGEKEAKCAECGKVLLDTDQDEIVEEKIDDEHLLFCSKECADAYETGKERKRGV